jgi:hypothetical protein
MHVWVQLNDESVHVCVLPLQSLAWYPLPLLGWVQEWAPLFLPD